MKEFFRDLLKDDSRSWYYHLESRRVDVLHLKRAKHFVGNVQQQIFSWISEIHKSTGNLDKTKKLLDKLEISNACEKLYNLIQVLSEFKKTWNSKAYKEELSNEISVQIGFLHLLEALRRNDEETLANVIKQLSNKFISREYRLEDMRNFVHDFEGRYEILVDIVALTKALPVKRAVEDILVSTEKIKVPLEKFIHDNRGIMIGSKYGL